jgi:hypothetical protein
LQAGSANGGRFQGWNGFYLPFRLKQTVKTAEETAWGFSISPARRFER